MIRVVFAHGLEGSPQGYKATYLKEQFDASAPWLGELGLAAQSMALIDAMQDQPTVLVGSSLGALAAWGSAQLRPDLISHLILLAPAVGYEHLAQDNPQVELQRPGLFAEVAAYGEKELPGDIEITIIHGMEDELIPTEAVVALAKRSPNVRLILVHAEHSLVDAKQLICHEIDRVLNER